MQTRVSYTPEETQLGVHPLKPVLWVFLVSTTMLFAALTSAYLVRRGDGNWLLFNLPTLFYWSTAAIVLSSIFMQLGYFFAKKDEIQKLKLSLFVTLLLGVAFLGLQWFSRHELIQAGIHFGSQMLSDGTMKEANPSGSFVYVLAGVHFVHILAALVFLLIVFVKALRYKVHSKSMLSISMCNTFWHYLGLVWVYLFVFMLVYR